MDPFDPMDPSGYAEPASTLDFLSFWVCSALPGLIVTALLVLGVLLLHRLVHQTRRIADALERRQDGEAPQPPTRVGDHSEAQARDQGEDQARDHREDKGDGTSG